MIQKYGETVAGIVNYFKMNADVNRKIPKVKEDAPQLISKLVLNDEWYDEHLPVGTEELLHQKTANISQNLGKLVEKLEKHVYKNRIRLTEFFRDYDRHNCGIVSENQFCAGLKLCDLPIDATETMILVNSFTAEPGRVNYRDFCASIDKVFTINHLETNPLATVQPPSREWLVQETNELSAEEEARCTQIINRYRDVIKQRRLLIVPFFKDFDKRLGGIGRVTRAHFSRLLSTVGLDVSDRDLHILFRKYEDHTQGKLNYMEFFRTIDPETYSTNKLAKKQQEEKSSDEKSQRQRQPDISKLISRIQNHVRTKRIRVGEFFKDFDKLRSYSIRKSDFLRGFSYLGLDLTEAEQDVLCQKYEDIKRKGYCRWKEFDSDIEKG